MKTLTNWSLILLGAIFLACGCQMYTNELPGGPDGGSVKDGNDQPQTPCDEARLLMQTWIDQRCENRWPQCCFCECWLDGRQIVQDWDNCTCTQGGDLAPSACEDELLQMSQDCLADQAECRKGMVEVVDVLCDSE